MAISNRVAIDLRPSQFPADDTPRSGPGPALRLKKPSHRDDRPTKTMSPPRTLVEPKEIGFYIYLGFSALDLSGPLEVFATSGAKRRRAPSNVCGRRSRKLAWTEPKTRSR
jgi:hypothetical protein